MVEIMNATNIEMPTAGCLLFFSFGALYTSGLYGFILNRIRLVLVLPVWGVYNVETSGEREGTFSVLTQQGTGSWKQSSEIRRRS